MPDSFRHDLVRPRHRLLWVALFFGSVTEAASDIVNDNPQRETLFERVGGQAGLADAYLSAIIGILGFAAFAALL